MKTWKTPKGTELTLIDLKGKDYLPVQQRVIWFREEHPMGRIETQIVSHSPASSVCRASIFILNGKGEYVLLAQGTKSETSQGFSDHLEKSETSAIGRALALCGYGTQFTGDDLAEGERIVDGPVARPVVHKPVSPRVVLAQSTPPLNGKFGGPSEAQIGRLYTIAAKSGWSKPDVDVMMATRYGIQSTKELTRQQYNEVCDVVLPQGPMQASGDPGPSQEPVWSDDQAL